MLPSPKIFVGYICAITATLFWGFHTVVIRYLAAQDVPPLGIAVMRLFIGGVILTFIFTLTAVIKKQNPFQKFPTGNFFWYAVIGLAVNYLFFHTGLKYTIASDAILIEAMAPVTVFILVLLLLPSRIKHLRQTSNTLQRILFIFLATAIGSSLLLVNNPQDALLQNSLKLRGDLWELGAMFLFALFMLGNHEYLKRNPQQDPIKIMACIFLVSGVILAPFVPWSFLGTLTPLQWTWILVLGVLSTAAGYAFWQIATKNLDILPLVLLFSLSSVFTVVVEAILFQLELSLTFIIATVLILWASITTQILNARMKWSQPEEMTPS